MYNHKSIETKWQTKWAEAKTFSPNLDKAKKPFYNLMMFPYPSAEGLHVGHTYAFGGADAYGRFMRLQGYDVFEPMGFDAFGIHSENFAIKRGFHPSELIAKTTAYFRERQMKRYGGMWDWSRQVDTTDPNYYHWTQWIFVQFFKNGLVERKKAFLNWCPSCKTVLSDEQVEKKSKVQSASWRTKLKVEINVCERCKTEVEKKETEQWFFKISNYSQRLLDYHGTQWPQTTRTIQTNWIGRSTGAIVKFPILNSQFSIDVFTTRPDTLFGATFLVLSPEHPFVASLLKLKVSAQGRLSYGQKSQKSKVEEIKKYLESVKNKSAVDRETAKEKTGVFTGLYALNPVNQKKIPIWIADYVLMDYGTGAIMGVPAHDQRDWDFAQKYHLPIIPVIQGSTKWNYDQKAWDGEGKLTNSGPWNGWQIPSQAEKVITWLTKNKIGWSEIRYKLRDWCISRQRYWGPPIPMIYCPHCAKRGESWFTTEEAKNYPKAKKGSQIFENCSPAEALAKAGSLVIENSAHWAAGWYPVDEKDLPIKLPYIKDYQPKGQGKSPLAQLKSFCQVRCPHCGQEATRETDVSDTFLDSAWYFFRYPSVRSALSGQVPWDDKLTKKWLPVDMYIGGNEHACLHLLYTRFVTMAFYDLGLIDFEEPFKRFFAHGLIIKDGFKMSKSRGNVINPEDYIDKCGADALRMYLLFLGPISQGGDFRDTGMQGMRRFLNRLYQLAIKSAKKTTPLSETLSRKMHQTIKKMGDDFAKLRFNTAIAALMELVNVWQEEEKTANQKLVKTVSRLITPIAPHLAEELWQASGGKFSVLDSGWPKYNPALLVEEKTTVIIQVNGKVRDRLVVDQKKAQDQDNLINLAKKLSKIATLLKEKPIKKIIFVKGKLINFVV